MLKNDDAVRELYHRRALCPLIKLQEHRLGTDFTRLFQEAWTDVNSMRVRCVRRHAAKQPSHPTAVVQNRIERILTNEINYIGNAMPPFSPKAQLVLAKHLLLAISVRRAYGEEWFSFTQGLKDLCGIHGKVLPVYCFVFRSGMLIVLVLRIMELSS